MTAKKHSSTPASEELNEQANRAGRPVRRSGARVKERIKDAKAPPDEPWSGADWWEPGSPFWLRGRKLHHRGRKPLSFPEGSMEKIRKAIQNARTKSQLQQAQALWLRVAHGFTAMEIEAATGWSNWHVRRFHMRYLRQGDAALAGPGRGGRRRGILGFAQEQILLRKLRREFWPNAVIDVDEVHAAYDEAAGRHVSLSTIHRMLARHGWRKRPLAQIPEPVGPARAYFIRLGTITKKKDAPGRKRFDRWSNGW